MSLTYKKAGGDIHKAGRFVEAIKKYTKSTARKGANCGLGGFKVKKLGTCDKHSPAEKP